MHNLDFMPNKCMEQWVTSWCTFCCGDTQLWSGWMGEFTSSPSSLWRDPSHPFFTNLLCNFLSDVTWTNCFGSWVKLMNLPSSNVSWIMMVSTNKLAPFFPVFKAVNWDIACIPENGILCDFYLYLPSFFNYLNASVPCPSAYSCPYVHLFILCFSSWLFKLFVLCYLMLVYSSVILFMKCWSGFTFYCTYI